MCSICGRNPCNTRCPNFTQPKLIHYCSICNYGILYGEEYIENDVCEYAHLECINGKKDLLDFLGYRLRIMEDGR